MSTGNISTNVCVIGSGVAGGIVSKELLSAGIDGITMVEAGGVALVRDRRRWYDYLSTKRSQALFPGAWPEPNETINTGNYHYLPQLLRIRGGATMHWGGWAYRLKPEDFRLKSNTGRGEDWPISYDDLEPYYGLAESTLQVAGDANDAGHPPRTVPFPLPAVPYQYADDPFLNALDQMGYSVQHHCVSRNTEPVHGMAQCQTIGTCSYCPIGARFTGNQVVDYLEGQAGFRLLLQTSVLRVIFTARNRVSGVLLLNQETGEEYTLEANHVIVCGGGIQSPKLLLQSANTWWPEGVANDSDQVGRYLTNHVDSATIGFMANPDGWFHETGELSTIVSRQFDSPDMQHQGKFLMSMNQFRPQSITDMMLGDLSIDEIRNDLRKVTSLSISGMVEQTTRADNRVTLGTGKDAVGLPKASIHYTLGEHTRLGIQKMLGITSSILHHIGCETPRGFEPAKEPSIQGHHMGTCRMGRFPESSVVDSDLRVHGCENLDLCSSAVFPSCGAANPTLTIAALAHRLGQRLAKAL